jgi:hypothetical protein
MSPFYGVGALAYRWRIELQKWIEECANSLVLASG